MKREKYIIYFCLFITLLSEVSCKKDYLDIPPTLTVVRQQHIRDIKSCEELLNGIYIILARDLYQGLHHKIYPELIADNVKPFPNNSAYSNQYAWAQTASDNRALTPGNSDVNINSLYTSGYEVIRNCNYIIENIDRFREENSQVADNIKGQCYSIRALVHHDLVKAFAQPYKFSSDASHPGIPYVTTWDFKKPVSRLTVAEVYNNIINDFNMALELMSENSNSKFYMSSNAVKALLARTFLFKDNYESAKNLSREVILKVPIMKGNSYPSKLYTAQDIESIFQLIPSSSPYSTLFSSYYYKLSPNPVFIATNDIAELLNERSNDKRRAWITKVSGNWKIVKFPSGVVSGVSDTIRSYYETVIRSSELCLIAAESYAKIGQEDSARYYLDEIRQRADLSATPITANGGALLDSIYKEKRKELAFEGFRMYELLRIGQAITRIDAPISNAKNLPYPNQKGIAPIPNLEVTLSGIDQNLGY